MASQSKACVKTANKRLRNNHPLSLKALNHPLIAHPYSIHNDPSLYCVLYLHLVVSLNLLYSNEHDIAV